MKNRSLKRVSLLLLSSAAFVLASLVVLPAVLAAQPFGAYLGQFHRVAAYSNGAAIYNSNTNNFVNGIKTGLKWQCVEYVRRYFLTVFNTDLASRYTGNANTWYSNAAAMGLEQYPNGGTTPPQVGDILCSTGPSSNGHVAIIKRITGNKVYTAQQNFSNDSTDLDKPLTLTVSNGTYHVGGYSGIQGWLRRPAQAGQAYATWHPDGSLLLDDAGTVWLIERGRKRGIPNQWTMSTNGFHWYRVVRATPQEISCYTTDPALQPGTSQRLVKNAAGTVYLLTDRGYRRGFASASVFEGLGYSWSEVAAVSDAELALYPDDPAAPVLTSPYPEGALIQKQGTSTVYVVSNGKKRGIATGSAFMGMGYDWGRVLTVPADVFDSISEGQTPIDDGTMYQCPRN
jgi:surface antigen